MHPVVQFAGSLGGRELAGWLWRNRDEIGAAFPKLYTTVLDSLAGGDAITRRGGTLVALEEGQEKVIAVLHRQGESIDGIRAAVDGIGTVQTGIAEGVTLLGTLSMVGLGFAALSQVHIAWQFKALRFRLDSIQRTVSKILGMLRDAQVAQLNGARTNYENGLNLAAKPDESRAYFKEAEQELNRCVALFAANLRGALAAKEDPAEMWLLARYLTHAALFLAASQLQQGHPELAVNTLESAVEPLVAHARSVFSRTVGGKTTAYLIPALAAHGVTLERLAELFRQASDAGVMERRHDLSASDLYEELRQWLPAGDPILYKASKVDRLRAEFREASAAVEEINRLRGLILMLRQYRGEYADLARDVTESVRSSRDLVDGQVYAVFPSTPSR